jgi:3-oxoacyl-(acyl-carrier-protein) synthase
MRGDTEALADDLVLLGIGWAVEPIPSATGVSSDGNAFKAAMAMALAQMQQYGCSGVDCVVAHAPGTLKGDAAELAAIYSVFGSDVDVLSTKHLTGHTYGASGMVSLQLASSLLTEQAEWGGFPYLSCIKQPSLRPPKTVAINTAGFGGNSISIIVANRPNKAVHP